MKPKTAKIEFENFVRQRGTTIGELTPTEGIQFTIEFYSQVRVEKCPIEEDGDMLLFQWGVYNWGDGDYFQFDITRQFIEEGFEGDDAISQLSLTFFYQPTEKLKNLESGNRWCESPNDVKEFESYIKGNSSYILVSNIKPDKIEAHYSKV